MKALTVITTTYNRAYCLHQVYESLCRQTCGDFIWLIVDDGSTDDTKQKVDAWIGEKRVEIEYCYKENGGMHTARNLAYNKVHTEINVIIDSDDWMTDDAVEKIVSFWKKNGSERFYGMITENIDTKGKLIGTALPANVSDATLTDIFSKYQVKGDKKIILRSDLSKLNPFPEFPGEKFYPASYKYKLLDQKYTLLVLPEAIGVVDYNDDSMTFDKFKQYKTCPRGFAHYRNEMLKLEHGKALWKDAVHYVVESKFARAPHYIKNSCKPILITVCVPVGLLLYLYLGKTRRKY